MIHQPDQLILKHCAYYLNLKDASIIDGVEKPTVYVPSENILTPSALHELMLKASKFEKL